MTSTVSSGTLNLAQPTILTVALMLRYVICLSVMLCYVLWLNVTS